MATEETSEQQSTDGMPVDSSGRRAFLKGSLTTAAAVAGAGGLAAAGEPGAGGQAPAEQPRRSTSYQLNFSTQKPPHVEDIHKALAQVFGHSGCTTCGLLGVDLRLLAVDPVPVEANVPVNVFVQRH